MHSTEHGGPRHAAAKDFPGRRTARLGFSLGCSLLMGALLALTSASASAQTATTKAPTSRTAKKRTAKDAKVAKDPKAAKEGKTAAPRVPRDPSKPRVAKTRKGAKGAPGTVSPATSVDPATSLSGGPSTDDPFASDTPPVPPASEPRHAVGTEPLPVASPGSPSLETVSGTGVAPAVVPATGSLPLDAPAASSTVPATATVPAHAAPVHDNIPASAPFSQPTMDRPMPPPAGLAGLDGPDPLAGASALEESVSRMQSEAIVTTASKRRQRISDVPLTVSWIPAEELEGTGQFSLCEAIQYFPGMECRRGSMRKAAVSSRGLGSNYLSNRLLLLKDGRPLTDPWTGQFYADETTPMTNLKQVEVIRGPGSSLYGSNAFSGVINLIERQPADLIPEGRSVGMDARVLAGQDKTWRVQANVAGRGGPVEALLGYYGYGSDGPQLFNDPHTGQVDTNEDSRVHQVSGKMKVGPVSLDAAYTDAKLGRPGGTNISTVGNCGRCHYTPDDTERAQNLNAAAQVDQQVTENLRLFAQAYAFFKRRDVTLESAFDSDPTRALGKRRRLGGEARALFSMGDLNVTFGGDVKNDVVNNPNVLPTLTMDDTRQTILGGFVDAEYRPMSRLVLSAGARYDRYQIPETVWHTRTDQVSPRASVVFHAIPELLTVRTNYGRAFRAPTLAELAINQQMYAATLVGNADLRAETLDTFEAAVDFWPFDRRVRLTGTGFFNRAKNFINQELVFGSVSQFRNIGNADVAGAELEAAAQVPALNSSFDIAYQFLDAKAVPYGDGEKSTLDYAPSHRLYLRGRTNIGKAAFAELYALVVGPRFDPGFNVDPTTGLATSRVRLAGFVTASARVGVNIHDGISVSLLGTNLFNAKYEESHGFPAPPLAVFSELKVRY
ncbi:TonB-dependent receptor [Corallococcus sp. M34]|uniref:TonB-dependent receptor plug domain-containing protein n=1 Tax=Citreicoccus inhibens TaxID=2849499 RepID=UPI001C21DD9B|nr:TonB-dependent receptor [Citreicoccus inhibens]MBU8896503.1 TonB-dependent receptor [Citreicoccus inhibens]